MKSPYKKAMIAALTANLVITLPLAAAPADDAAAAETSEAESPQGKANEIPPPPKEISKKRPLTQLQYDTKKEDWYITGLPLINNDPNRGVGYGARIYYYDNGPKDDEFFAYTPYRTRLYGQFFQTTNGFQFHELNYDSPYVGGSLFRIIGRLSYEANLVEPYFGVSGNNSNSLTGPTGRFDKFADYNESLREINGGTTDAYYNFYDFEEPAVTVALQRDFFGSRVRGLFGYRFDHRTVNDYSGDKIDVDDKSATQNRTRLREDRADLTGYNGGNSSAIRLGIAYDTRDFEPDPTSGMFIEATADFAGAYSGSDFDFVRVSFIPKFYFTIIDDLVFANRILYQFISTEDAPFWEYSTIANTTYSNDSGYMGGLRSMRGFKPNRFVGQSFNEFNFELRWTMFRVGPWAGQRFAFLLVPFFEVGQAHDSITVGVDDLKASYGAGLRIAWNQATIIMVDYALSREGGDMYINFNHIF